MEDYSDLMQRLKQIQQNKFLTDENAMSPEIPEDVVPRKSPNTLPEADDEYKTALDAHKAMQQEALKKLLNPQAVPSELEDPLNKKEPFSPDDYNSAEAQMLKNKSKFGKLGNILGQK